jgi:hypothetical protein
LRTFGAQEEEMELTKNMEKEDTARQAGELAFWN